MRLERLNPRSGVGALLLAAAALASPAGAASTPAPAIYPPSCLSLPLPVQPQGPAQQKVVQLADIDGNAANLNGPNGYFESVTVTAWRVRCSGGRTAVLVRFDRPANAGGMRAADIPIVSVSGAGVSDLPMRFAYEPNTAYEFATGDSIVEQTVVVLDAVEQSPLPDLNQAFSLQIDTFVGTALQRSVLALPAFDLAGYPGAGDPLPISGHLSGNWFDPAHGGEGAQIEVGELPAAGATNNRYLVFAWYTFDTNGTAYWLFGLGIFSAGDRMATASVAYASGGGFAGAFGASATTADWGTVTVRFPDCNTLQFDYQAAAGLPAAVPQGTGSRTWSRLTSIAGLACD
jgi:hypothetical protein